jgi:alpha-amylase
MANIIKKFYSGILTVSISSLLFFGCSKPGNESPPDPIVPLPAVESTTPSQEVMLQTFYWDVEPRGGWWDLLNTKLDAWKTAGITALWLPVISKGQSGGFSMGYDPYDYFDFGQYNQQGTTETRFGSYAELTSLLTNAKAKGFKLIADIILNHNSGGDLEVNPIKGSSTYTKFTPLSGKFNRRYEDFHPNSIHAKDDDQFGGMPDLCHDVPNVKDWFYKRADGVGKFYKNTLGFDGWRFDFVKGFSPNVIKEWNAEVGGFSIIEYYDGNVTAINNYLTAATSGAFDFPLMFALKDAFNGNDLTRLNGAGLISINPSKAYTFITNHDVERDQDKIQPQNKLKAYAFIMASEGTPFIFYTDIESNVDKTKLTTLINIHKTLAAGSTTRLLSTASEYIFRRNGTPGLVAYFNNGPTYTERKIQTAWANATLKDYTGVNPDVTTDASGFAIIGCQANNYAIYSRK